MQLKVVSLLLHDFHETLQIDNYTTKDEGTGVFDILTIFCHIKMFTNVFC